MPEGRLPHPPVIDIPTTSETREKINLPPMVIALSGPPLTGKTTIAMMLAEHSNAQVFDVDAIRQAHYPPLPGPRDPQVEKETMPKVYEKMYELAGEAINSGAPVILVATFSKDTYHQALANFCEDLGQDLPFIRFLLKFPPETIEAAVTERLTARNKKGSDSNIKTFADFDEVNRRFIDMDGAHKLDPALKPEEILTEAMRVLSPYAAT
ncbi:MAG: AAA family ATPase [Weeksellaceae bacterium]